MLVDERTFAEAIGTNVPAVPLVVLRIPDLHRIAWESGRRAARAVEREVSRAFVRVGRSILREHDVLAHHGNRNVFLAALTTPTRDEAGLPRAVDTGIYRPAQFRLANRVAAESRVEVEGGWATFHAGDVLDEAIERAIARGARDRERFAFFASVSHELRTPLAAVSAALELAADSEGEGSEHATYLDLARAETLRLGRLLDGLFEMSVLDLDGESLDIGRCTLDDVARAVERAAAPVAVRAGVRVSIGPIADGIVPISRERLVQVVLNLIHNAIAHGGCVTQIVVAAHADRKRIVRLCVDDDGIGVPAEEREAVFAFRRRGCGVRATGAGIGLAIARRILERSSADIHIEASPLGGARFCIRLPVLS